MEPTDLDRASWDAPVPDGVYLPDRVRRCAQEQAVRLLRSALYRRGVLSVVVAGWPTADGVPRPKGRRDRADWEALRAAARTAGVSTDAVTVRNVSREVARHLAATGSLPGSLPELQTRPRPGSQVLLAAGDRQLATLVRSGDRQALLTVTLPTRPDPRGRADWQPVVLCLPLPPHVPADADLRMPALRLTRRPDGRPVAHADLTFDRTPVPAAPAAGHVRAIGFDRGVRTLLTGAFGWLPPAASSAGTGVAVRTTGRPVVFDASGAADKLRLLREAGERVHRRIARHDDLLRGHEAAGTVPPAPLVAKRLLLLEELARVSARRRHLDAQLARAAARWMLEQAVAHGATAIYLEDLRDLEAGPRAASVRRAGPKRARVARRNANVSNTVRRQVVDAVRHLAGQSGITVVTVPAAGTSRDCPRCLTALSHAAAPDRTGDGARVGGAWASCPGCGYSAGRDHAAAERILARGLGTQHAVRTDPAGARTVTTRTRGTPTPGMDTPARRTRQRRPARPAPAPTTGTTAPATTAGTRVPRPGPAAPPNRGAQRPAGRRPSPQHHRGQAPGTTTGRPTTPPGGAPPGQRTRVTPTGTSNAPTPTTPRLHSNAPVVSDA